MVTLNLEEKVKRLKTELDKLPKDKVIENFNVKSRFRVSTQ